MIVFYCISGTWVRLDSESTRKYCFTDGEAWSLAVSRGKTLYLQSSQSNALKSNDQQSNALMNTSTGSQQGFDFTMSQQNSGVFKPFQSSPSSSTGDPFVFGAPSKYYFYSSKKTCTVVTS